MTTAPTTASAFDAIAANAPRTCPFCKQPLRTTTVNAMGREYTVPCFGSCGCSRSAAKMGEMDGKGMTEKERREQRYLSAGIGSRYLAAHVERPEHYQAVKRGRGLFVTGEVGSGKTFLASAVAMRLMDDGKAVRFESMVNILRQLQADFNAHASDVLEKCMSCDVLVLDDLGKEKPTEWALSVLFEVVNLRYANGLPIIVTTNYAASELIERLSAGNRATAEAIVSRLHESCDTVRLSGNRRLK